MNDIGCPTAPFEADSQLAFLARTGAVQYILSEDADLVVLGCPRVLRSLDWKAGTALLVSHAQVIAPPTTPPKGTLLAALSGRGEGGLRLLALLAGCDYCRIPKIGLCRAKGRSSHACQQAQPTLRVQLQLLQPHPLHCN